MQERHPGRIEPDMDVCDLDGANVGTVVRVHRYDLAAIGTAGAELPPSQEKLPPGEDVVEVKTGWFGFGQHLYIPMGAVEGLSKDAVFLSRRKDDFDRLGWHDKPPHLGELR